MPKVPLFSETSGTNSDWIGSAHLANKSNDGDSGGEQLANGHQMHTYRQPYTPPTYLFTYLTTYVLARMSRVSMTDDQFLWNRHS